MDEKVQKLLKVAHALTLNCSCVYAGKYSGDYRQVAVSCNEAFNKALKEAGITPEALASEISSKESWKRMMLQEKDGETTFTLPYGCVETSEILNSVAKCLGL